jgi:hypothetical protein
MALIYLIASDHVRLRQSPALIDDVTGQVASLVLTPTLPKHLSSKEFVDTSFGEMAPKNLTLTVRGTYVTDAEVAVLDAEIALLANSSDLTALSNALVKLTGSTITGPIVYDGTPQTADELINKDYIDDISDLIPDNLLTQAVADTRYLSQSGGTMTGPILLDGSAPPSGLAVISKEYVDTRLVSFSGVLRKSGGTMTGPLIMDRTPLHPSETATKRYVDLWNNWLQAPIQPYITSGAIIAVLHPFFGTRDSSGKLTRIRNFVRTRPEFDMLPTGEALTMLNSAFWTPTATSGMTFASETSILTNSVIIGVSNDSFTGILRQPVASALRGDGSSFVYWRGLSGNRVNIGAEFTYRAADATETQAVTSKRGRPTTNSIYTHEFFRNVGDDVTGVRIWDYNMNNLGVNGNPGLGQADGFIKTFGVTPLATDGFYPGSIGPVIVVNRAAPDYTAAQQAAVDWVLSLQALYPLA